MRYWLNTTNGEWGIVRGSERNDLALSGPVGTLVVDQFEESSAREQRHTLVEMDPGLMVLEKSVFLKLYETLERMSFTPVYSPVQPMARN
jgi:hypothetical protein